MGELIFVTGGARSGKSRFAETLLAANQDVIYIATALAYDEEMKERIRQHRASRNPRWFTIEAYRDIAGQLEPHIRQKEAVLLDCLTLMITNLMLDDRTLDWEHMPPAAAERFERQIAGEIDRMTAVMQSCPGPAVIVSNEVGMGLVPEYPLARHFRDMAGRMNQKLASAADRVYFLVSGIPLQIKGQRYA